MRIYISALALMISCIICAFTANKSLVVTSSAFTNNGPIPVKYTCKGAEFSPPLSFGNIPPETKSLVIIVDNPEATKSVVQQKVCVPNKAAAKSKKGRQTVKKSNIPVYETVQAKCCFTHWVIWNIEPNNTFIPENFVNETQGLNGSNECRYQGMCPTTGTHKYHFKVYALDTKLNIPTKSDKAAVEKVMEGHILAWGELVGTFNKNYK